MSRHIPIPPPVNEPVLDYAPGSPERAALKARLTEMAGTQIDIPLIIGGKEVRTGRTKQAVMPHRHGHVLATWHRAGKAETAQAIAAAHEAYREWSSWRWEDRAAVFLRAADLLATTWRDTLNAATMLCQSKTPHQAEIDAACEIVDFWRFNVHYADRLYAEQPISDRGIWNRVEYRPLEGFVLAITPFNFTSIGANLPTAPAIMGNTVVWKPASTAVYSSYYIYRLLEAAGLPPGVINFIPGDASAISDTVLHHADLAGIHFTGSTGVFQQLWRTVGENVAQYKSYPRVVGETGGKDFIVAHPSADPAALATAMVRGAFEYQGQKCSAASRVYIPDTMWRAMRKDVLDTIAGIPMGDVADFRTFMGAIIDQAAFDDIKGYVDHAKASPDAEILVGGECDPSEGYFIRPTLIQAKKPDYKSICEEIFGPVLTLYVYPEKEWDAVLRTVDGTSPYALTGAVFADDRRAVTQAMQVLRHAAGNFYVNDKPTGAVVGQQPFGGARASGTNDKAGSMLNLVRWVSARSIKETFVPATDYRYPYMHAE
ncbi:MAG: L-glutamate gamma-semialdehyde dehydrogenase [Gemmatimonadota bacterium]|nr:L-glutamate gamma-semialdehyde dehydrogenase [Gemmatimonadota bacterium]MDH5195654.1 L-glutamate gamma-semialdehyde dehydrogenase [Gemmatimonadota bacterium]